MKCGVVVFPGSNCDHDVYHVWKHVLQQEATFLWHQDDTLQGLRAGGAARRLRLRRLPARRRHGRAVAGDGGGQAPRRGRRPGARHLQRLPGACSRPGCCRAPCGATRTCASSAATSTCASSATTCRSPAACGRGQVLRMPIAHAEGNYEDSPERLDALEAARPGGLPLLLARPARSTPAVEPQRRGARHRRHRQPRRQRPRADAAPRALRRGDPRQHRRPGDLRRAVEAGAPGACARGGSGALMAADDGAAAEPPVDRASWRARTASPTRSTSGCAQILGRDPNYTELGITSALWTEHCSYKSSKVYLQGVPHRAARTCSRGRARTPAWSTSATAGSRCSRWSRTTTRASSSPTRARRPASAASCATSSPWARAPSPAWTRCASASSTRPRMRFLVDGVVRGIGDYGNCVGIPTVGGETGFHRCYNGNILVNAFALGHRPPRPHLPRPAPAAPATRSSTSAAAPAATASTAPPWPRSRSTPRARPKRPTVQVGDPFTEKVLLEACLEAMRDGRHRRHPGHGRRRPDQLDASRWRAAAAPASALDLDRVPLREPGLTPYEMMLSESQERMVLVAQRGREEEVRARSSAAGASRWRRSARSPTTGRAVLALARRDGRPTCRSGR